MRRGERGYTLIELLLVLVVVVMIVVATLDLFDGMGRVARVQVDLADLQQSQRVAQNELVRLVRMAGRGGLHERPVAVPGEVSVAALAPIAVRNNVTAGGRVVVAGQPAQASPGSDVLVVRGVFGSPVFRVDYVDAASWTPPGSDPAGPAFGRGTIVLRGVTPTGLPQDLGALGDAIAAGSPEALVVADALDEDVLVAELLPGESTFEPGDEDVVGDEVARIAFRVRGSALADRYAQLSPGGAATSIDKVLSVGLLEEHRFYVRDGGDGPALLRARVFPNSETLYDGEIDVEVAPGVEDLQVALGFDSPLAGYFACDPNVEDVDDSIVDDGGGNDDWLFNAAADDPTAVPWAPPAGGWDPDVASWDPAAGPCPPTPRPRLYYARVSTLARTLDPDPYHDAGAVETLEDSAYVPAEAMSQRYRRRLLQTTVDLRNS